MVAEVIRRKAAAATVREADRVRGRLRPGRSRLAGGGLPRIKAREGMENVIIKNFIFKDEIVRRWRSRKNMPNFIQNRVGSKNLRHKFSHT